MHLLVSPFRRLLGFVRLHHTRRLTFKVLSSHKYTLCATLRHYNHALHVKARASKAKHINSIASCPSPSVKANVLTFFSPRQCECIHSRLVLLRWGNRSVWSIESGLMLRHQYSVSYASICTTWRLVLGWYW